MKHRTGAISFWRAVISLIQKDWILEWRQKYAISGIFLYVVSSVFTVYTTLGQEIGGAIWNAFFWIMILFASVNAVAKSFMQENPQRQLYYYTLANPLAIICAKIIYNSLLLFALTLLSYAMFVFILGNPVKETLLFFSILFLGSIGFSITFTFIAAIAAKASGSATLMTILSFPVILPILLTLLRLSKQALRLMQDTAYIKDFYILLAVDTILIGLVVILFPYLWRE